MDEDTRITVEHILAQDPRAAYNKARDYIYGMRYGKFDIRFVADSHAGTIEIVDVVECIYGYHKGEVILICIWRHKRVKW